MEKMRSFTAEQSKKIDQTTALIYILIDSS